MDNLDNNQVKQAPITREPLLMIGAKEWMKPGTEEKRFYINPNSLLEMAEELSITNTMSHAEITVFNENKWWYNEKLKLKTSLSHSATKHKYLMNSVPDLIEKLVNAASKI